MKLGKRIQRTLAMIGITSSLVGCGLSYKYHNQKRPSKRVGVLQGALEISVRDCLFAEFDKKWPKQAKDLQTDLEQGKPLRAGYTLDSTKSRVFLFFDTNGNDQVDIPYEEIVEMEENTGKSLSKVCAEYVPFATPIQKVDGWNSFTITSNGRRYSDLTLVKKLGGKFTCDLPMPPVADNPVLYVGKEAPGSRDYDHFLVYFETNEPVHNRLGELISVGPQNGMKIRKLHPGECGINTVFLRDENTKKTFRKKGGKTVICVHMKGTSHEDYGYSADEHLVYSGKVTLESCEGLPGTDSPRQVKK